MRGAEVPVVVFGALVPVVAREPVVLAVLRGAGSSSSSVARLPQSVGPSSSRSSAKGSSSALSWKLLEVFAPTVWAAARSEASG